jgi:2-keto-4-pentenoate hydratase/2-oxohepta-3-ene-1,7-dioic acid hydratase in catechol pathway
VKSFLSFEDGDVIMTGTPAGVGPVRTGDRFSGKIFAGEELLTGASWVVQ